LTGTADNTFSGGTTINAGELQISDSQALGTGGVFLNGGALTARGGSRSPANPVTIGGPFILNGGNGGGNLLTLSGSVNLSGSTRTVTVDATGGAVLSGVISNGGLTKAGGATLTISGANNFSGDTRIAAGTLTLGSNAALQNSTLDMNGADAGSLSFGSRTAASFGGLKRIARLEPVKRLVRHRGCDSWRKRTKHDLLWCVEWHWQQPHQDRRGHVDVVRREYVHEHNHGGCGDFAHQRLHR
jgi:fibronectin-binding autotransporter adhesin